MTKKDEEKIIKKKTEILYQNNRLLLLGIFSVFVVTLFIIQETESMPELSNNVTLVVEIAVGVIVAMIVFVTTKKSEKQNEQMLKQIQHIVEQEKSLTENRRKGLTENVMSNILSLKIYSNISKFQEPLPSYITPLNHHKSDLEKIIDDYGDILQVDEKFYLERVIRTIEKIIETIKLKEDVSLRGIYLMNLLDKKRIPKQFRKLN